jgi:hypothetical protein
MEASGRRGLTRHPLAFGATQLDVRRLWPVRHPIQIGQTPASRVGVADILTVYTSLLAKRCNPSLCAQGRSPVPRTRTPAHHQSSRLRRNVWPTVSSGGDRRRSAESGGVRRGAAESGGERFQGGLRRIQFEHWKYWIQKRLEGGATPSVRSHRRNEHGALTLSGGDSLPISTARPKSCRSNLYIRI